jgi:hypothetical protein
LATAAGIALLLTGPVARAQGHGQEHAKPPMPHPAVHAADAVKPANASTPKPEPKSEAASAAKPAVKPAPTPERPESAAARLTVRPALAAKLTPLLPPGTNLMTAAAGFRNLGQFVAAVHVSHDLGIPFSALRAKMTGPNAVSLGQAIQALKPGTNVRAEVRRAQAAARHDLHPD